MMGIEDPLEVRFFDDDREGRSIIDRYLDGLQEIMRAQNKSSEEDPNGGARYSLVIRLQVIKEEWA